MVHDKTSAVLLYRTIKAYAADLTVLSSRYNCNIDSVLMVIIDVTIVYIVTTLQLLIDICNSVNFNITKCNF